MLADRAGLNFNKIRQITKQGYPRAEGLPSAGFAAGPVCLKIQCNCYLFLEIILVLENSSMLVNEGLVLYLIDKLESKFNLKKYWITRHGF